MTKEEIESAAKEYAEVFRYKTETSGWFEQKRDDFIAGFNFAIQSENVQLKAEREWISVKDAIKVRKAIALMNSMIVSGEQHSVTSTLLVKEAIDILNKPPKQ